METPLLLKLPPAILASIFGPLSLDTLLTLRAIGNVTLWNRVAKLGGVKEVIVASKRSMRLFKIFCGHLSSFKQLTCLILGSPGGSVLALHEIEQWTTTLPPTMTEIRFYAIERSLELWTRPGEAHDEDSIEDIPCGPMHTYERMDERFPRLHTLHLDRGDNSWTQGRLRGFLQHLPRSLTSLRLPPFVQGGDLPISLLKGLIECAVGCLPLALLSPASTPAPAQDFANPVVAYDPAMDQPHPLTALELLSCPITELPRLKDLPPFLRTFSLSLSYPTPLAKSVGTQHSPIAWATLLPVRLTSLSLRVGHWHLRDCGFDSAFQRLPLLTSLSLHAWNGVSAGSSIAQWPQALQVLSVKVDSPFSSHRWSSQFLHLNGQLPPSLTDLSLLGNVAGLDSFQSLTALRTLRTPPSPLDLTQLPSSLTSLDVANTGSAFRRLEDIFKLPRSLTHFSGLIQVPHYDKDWMFASLRIWTWQSVNECIRTYLAPHIPAEQFQLLIEGEFPLSMSQAEEYEATPSFDPCPGHLPFPPCLTRISGCTRGPYPVVTPGYLPRGLIYLDAKVVIERPSDPRTWEKYFARDWMDNAQGDGEETEEGGALDVDEEAGKVQECKKEKVTLPLSPDESLPPQLLSLCMCEPEIDYSEDDTSGPSFYPPLRAAPLLTRLTLYDLEASHIPCLLRLPATLTELRANFSEVGLALSGFPQDWLPNLKKLQLGDVRLELRDFLPCVRKLNSLHVHTIFIHAELLHIASPTLGSTWSPSIFARNAIGSILPLNTTCLFEFEWCPAFFNALPANLEHIILEAARVPGYAPTEKLPLSSLLPRTLLSLDMSAFGVRHVLELQCLPTALRYLHLSSVTDVAPKSSKMVLAASLVALVYDTVRRGTSNSASLLSPAKICQNLPKSIRHLAIGLPSICRKS